MADRLFPPRAFLIGAQKAGTSSLASLLAQHPAVNLARGKEIHFFSTHWDKGLGWYEVQFDPKLGAEILLDASTSYSSAPLGSHTPKDYVFRDDRLRMPERMAALRPDARLIYVLRDPVERIYSSYWQAVRYGWESRPLDQAVRENPEYVYGSLYYAQLCHYLRWFARESILLLRFDDLKRDPVGAARACLAFLGAGPVEFKFPEPRARNVGFRYNAFGHLLRTVMGSERALGALSGTARSILPRRMYDFLSQLVAKPVGRMDEEVRAVIEPYIADDYRQLLAFTGLAPGSDTCQQERRT